MNTILDAREQRSRHIQSLIKDNPHKTIAILKLNCVGDNKNPKYMRFIKQLFDTKMHNEFEFKINKSELIPSDDGDYYYYVIDDEGNLVKEKTIYIEDNDFLGRLIDIDVYSDRSISREDLACEMRKCLICDNYAHICVRTRAHKQEEIVEVVTTLIKDYLTDHLTQTVLHAMYDELEMYPKFGLVSHRDSGCHKDMNHETFVKSIFALRPYIKKYIQYGLNNESNPFKLQEIGQEAETEMFKATNNINTQKGLNFALGLFLPALSKAILHNEDTSFIINEIRSYSNEIIGNYYGFIEKKETLSNGDKIYLDYGVKGIRGEALDGFKMIFDIKSYDNLEYEDRLHEYMIHIMAELCDTTVIHKKGFKTLKRIRIEMDTLRKKGGYMKNKEEYLKLNLQYKAECISPGGSSDLLVLKMIYEASKNLIKKRD